MQQKNTLSPILLVEGNSFDEHRAVRAYSHTGHSNRLLVARTGEHAMTLLRGCRSGLAFGLVLLDLYVPRSGGCELLCKIRKDPFLKDVPVVLMGAKSEDDEEMERCAAQANTWIKKPCDQRELMDVLDSMVRFWMGKRACSMA